MKKFLLSNALVVSLVALSANGCAPRCTENDSNCWAENLAFAEPRDGGQLLPLTKVSSFSLESRGGVGAPAITNQPGAMALADSLELHPLEVHYDSPDCVLAICARVCTTPDACSNDSWCAPTGRADATGIFSVYAGFLAEPFSGSASFLLGLSPVSAAGCPSDLLARLERDDLSVSPLAGSEVSVSVSVAPGPLVP